MTYGCTGGPDCPCRNGQRVRRVRWVERRRHEVFWNVVATALFLLIFALLLRLARG